MDEKKFEMEIAMVINLLKRFRKMTDESDRRIVRDTIRAIVKELTRL